MFDNVRRISRQLFAYGTADVMVLVVNFLLLPVYTRVLSPREYGVLALLLVCEAVLKVLDRWGLDAAFLRFYYDYPTDEERKTLATTLASFIGVANGALAIVLIAAAGPFNQWLFGTLEFQTAFRLLVLNNFAGAFLFLPLTLLRIQERSRLFASLTFLRSFGTVLFRLLLVVALRYGILGIVWADVIITAMLLVAMARTTIGMLAPRFSRAMLRQLLGYGLPHVPHGLLIQTMGMSDRFLLGLYMPLRDVGVYLIGSTIAGVIKFYPVAFEAAWMPFAFDSLRRRDALPLFGRMATYAFAVLALLTVAIAGLAPPLIDLMLPAGYQAAESLVPLMTVAMAVQSLTWFLGTSINVSKQTRLFPIITAIGAAASVAANVCLIPPLGIRGAALALLTSQIVTTAITAYFAQRAYRIPYETARLAKVSGVSAITYASMVMATSTSTWQTLVVRAGLMALFPAGLLALRFFEHHELAEIRAMVTRLGRTTAKSAGLSVVPMDQ